MTAAEVRGTLTVEPRAVQRIAAAAATEVDHVGGAARRVMNVAVGDDAGVRYPRVEVQVDGSHVGVAVTCSIAYPQPVGAVTDRLRSHLTDRIAALTGLTPRSVRIDVAGLTPGPGQGSGARGRRSLS